MPSVGLFFGDQFGSGFWNGFREKFWCTAVPGWRRIGGKGASPLGRKRVHRAFDTPGAALVKAWRGGLSSLRQDTAASGPEACGAEGEPDLCKFAVDFGTFWVHVWYFGQFWGSLAFCGAPLDPNGQQDPDRKAQTLKSAIFWGAHFDTFFDILGLWFLAVFRDAL